MLVCVITDIPRYSHRSSASSIPMGFRMGASVWVVFEDHVSAFSGSFNVYVDGNVSPC